MRGALLRSSGWQAVLPQRSCSTLRRRADAQQRDLWQRWQHVRVLDDRNLALHFYARRNLPALNE